MSLRSLVTQTAHFLAGNVAGLILSVISFPILARLLSQGEYGTLVLVNTTTLLAVAIAKGGTSEGIVRFYGDYARTPDQLRTFTTTVLVTRLVQALAVVGIYLAGIELAGRWFHVDSGNLRAFAIMGIYCLARPITIIALNYFRALEYTVRFNVVGTVQKAAGIALGLGALLLTQGNLDAYFAGVAFVEIVAAVALMSWLLARYRFALSSFSPSFARTLLSFGIPLAATEIGYLLLQYVDRYLLAMLGGSAQLAVYAVGYNLPSYVNDAVMFSISYAIVPIYTNLFRDSGAEAVSSFLTRALRLYLAGALLACAGYAALATDVIRWLASDKYVASASFSPVILFALMLMGSNYITYAGLFVHKKSRLILIIMIASVTVKIIANLALIPLFGAAGAAYATLLACLSSAAMTAIAAWKLIPFRLAWGDLAYYGATGAVLYLVDSRIDTGHPSVNTIAKLVVGTLIACSALLLRERELRGELKGRVAAVSHRVGARRLSPR